MRGMRGIYEREDEGDPGISPTKQQILVAEIRLKLGSAMQVHLRACVHLQVHKRTCVKCVQCSCAVLGCLL
jgi:hypothetical protein